MARSRHLGNTSIITMECIALKDGLEIEGDSKVIIDCYNKNK